MLYLVATPIGNLGDISFRAIEILKSCDYILCEDTRHSLPLLKHYAIQKPLKSYHKFSEAKQEASLIEDLKMGKTIALISDAGTPGIADPGERLVKACHLHHIEVCAIPGASAGLVALTCSGLNTHRFQFVGFLPKKESELIHLYEEILEYRGTTICYESPHRLLNSIQILVQLAPERKIVIARELTKKFEELIRGSACDILKKIETVPVKGEIVILIDGNTSSNSEMWATISIEKHVEMLQETHHIPLQQAIKLAAHLRGVPKRSIYQKFFRDNQKSDLE